MSIPYEVFIKPEKVPTTLDLVAREVEIAVFEIFERHFPKNAKFRSDKLYLKVLQGARLGMVRQALRCTGGEQTRAAQRCGIDRNTISKIMKEHGIPRFHELPKEQRHEFTGRNKPFTSRSARYRSR